MINVLVFRSCFSTENYQHFVGKQPAENGYQPHSLFGAWSDPPELYALHLGMIFHIFVHELIRGKVPAKKNHQHSMSRLLRLLQTADNMKVDTTCFYSFIP
jgi:hypothetical protein